MTHACRQREPRRGVTLLEVMTAMSLSAAMMASSFVVMRSSYAAWRAHEEDRATASEATAVLRHFVQNARQGSGVTAITAPTDTSGALTISLADGSTLRWDHAGSTVTLSVNGAAGQTVATGISGLSFTGYRADGVTTTTSPHDVQAVRVAVTAPMPVGGTRTVSCFTWVRSW